MAKAKSRENLTPTQKRVKQPRRLIYGGPNQNADPDEAWYVIELYGTCHLGYSPIRHILGHKDEHFAERVIRQHSFGRNQIQWDLGELPAPRDDVLNGKFRDRVREIAELHDTLSDPYVVQLLTDGTWKSDNKHPKEGVCPDCGADVEESARFCSQCGARVNIKQRTLYDLPSET